MTIHEEHHDGVSQKHSFGIFRGASDEEELWRRPVLNIWTVKEEPSWRILVLETFSPKSETRNENQVLGQSYGLQNVDRIRGFRFL